MSVSGNKLAKLTYSGSYRIIINSLWSRFTLPTLLNEISWKKHIKC